MIKLKNIKINDSVIECDIYPENSLHPGRIVVDVKSKDMKMYQLPEGFEWCMQHVMHAKNKLVEFIDFDKVPEEKLIMWN